MKIIISTKDSVTSKFVYENVKCWYHDYGAFHIVFNDGRLRVYPDTHIWYIEEIL